MSVRRNLPVVVLTAAAVVLPATGALAHPNKPTGRPLTTALTGAAEVPGPGDPDGTGTARVRVNPGQRTVCWSLRVQGIAPALAAHIHAARAGVSGGVVVTLTAPTDGTSAGCTTVTGALARDLVRHPADYYVNVHNADFPAGALRGQLG